MLILPLLASVLQTMAAPAAPVVRPAPTASDAVVSSNKALVERAFADWRAGRGSFYDLITEAGTVTIAGQSPRSGTFTKAAFLRERATPFGNRFRTPVVPTNWTVWAADDQVFVRWDSVGTACDGRRYTNSYAYFLTMRDGRATALTMFLDMGAFDDVWNRCRLVRGRTGGGR